MALGDERHHGLDDRQLGRPTLRLAVRHTNVACFCILHLCACFFLAWMTTEQLTGSSNGEPVGSIPIRSLSVSSVYTPESAFKGRMNATASPCQSRCISMTRHDRPSPNVIHESSGYPGKNFILQFTPEDRPWTTIPELVAELCCRTATATICIIAFVVSWSVIVFVKYAASDKCAVKGPRQGRDPTNRMETSDTPIDHCLAEERKKDSSADSTLQTPPMQPCMAGSHVNRQHDTCSLIGRDGAGKKSNKKMMKQRDPMQIAVHQYIAGKYTHLMLSTRAKR
jgi:hypothetical protein